MNLNTITLTLARDAKVAFVDAGCCKSMQGRENAY
jgi:hypothetical protein